MAACVDALRMHDRNNYKITHIMTMKQQTNKFFIIILLLLCAVGMRAETSLNKNVTELTLTTYYKWPTDYERAYPHFYVEFPCDKRIVNYSVVEGGQWVHRSAEYYRDTLYTNVVTYQMFGKDLGSDYVPSTGDNVTIQFTVDFSRFTGYKSEYRFGASPMLYAYRDGVKVSADNVERISSSKAVFTFRYSVPTPEGGLYIRNVDATATINAPQIGAEPQWTLSNAAGAKPAWSEEANPKEHFDVRKAVMQNDLAWFSVGKDFNMTAMNKGDKFRAGSKYACRLTFDAADGTQFHELNTVYKLNGTECHDETYMTKSFYEQGNYATGVYANASQAYIYYIYEPLPSYLGDVNNDGAITMADANSVVNYFLASEKPLDVNTRLANVNRDDGITMADANQIVNMFLNGVAPEIIEDKSDAHDYVDLGLSVKWATCNVGATVPKECGSLFAWGETEQKYVFFEGTYKWYDSDTNKYTKYNATDGKTQLDLEDDAAAVNWGGAWRMPTDVEWTELRENCTWESVIEERVGERYGKPYTYYVSIGYKVTAANGNSIFLPEVYYGDEILFTGEGGDEYWSSTLAPSQSYYNAYGVIFIDDYGKHSLDRSEIDRYYPRPVRAVRP